MEKAKGGDHNHPLERFTKAIHQPGDQVVALGLIPFELAL
jgi:hypothetical protein